MSGLKKWMAIIMTSVTIMGNMTGQGIPVMGAEKEVQEVITSGNIYVTETGAKERVVKVNEDGSFVTEPVEEISSYVTNALSQRFPQKRYRALRLGSIWS